jgi:hypothetical protein
VTDLALKRYEEIKNNYNFVSFEEANKAKSLLIGTYERCDIPTYDFNQEMYKFKKKGFCANPNVEVKGYVFNENKLKANNEIRSLGDNDLEN